MLKSYKNLLLFLNAVILFIIGCNDFSQHCHRLREDLRIRLSGVIDHCLKWEYTWPESRELCELADIELSSNSCNEEDYYLLLRCNCYFDKDKMTYEDTDNRMGDGIYDYAQDVVRCLAANTRFHFQELFDARGYSLVPDDGGCYFDSNCINQSVCRDGDCVTISCKDDTDCMEDEICQEGVCSFLCDIENRECRISCKTDIDCMSGEYCAGRYCRPQLTGSATDAYKKRINNFSCPD